MCQYPGIAGYVVIDSYNIDAMFDKMGIRQNIDGKIDNTCAILDALRKIIHSE